jgi:thymidine phosphorylase
VQLVYDTLTSGKAYPYFEKMVDAHGGDVSVCQNYNDYLIKPKYTEMVTATQSGYIAKLDGMTVGNLCVQLGAGRLVAEEPVDPIAGMEFLAKEGDYVEENAPIARVQTNKSQEVLERVCTTLQESMEYSEKPVTVPFCISHRVTNQGTEEFVVPSCLE